MNRLKFRVWIPRIKKLSYDNFWISHTGQVYCISTPDLVYGKQHLLSLDDVEQVKDYVIQQFTGLLDSKDQEIYEGDIVENFTLDEEYCSPAVIVPTKYEYTGWSLAFKNKHLKDFQKNRLGHLINGIEVFEEFQLMQKNFGYYKIIGNIFENPELLES